MLTNGRCHLQPPRVVHAAILGVDCRAGVHPAVDVGTEATVQPTNGGSPPGFMQLFCLLIVWQVSDLLSVKV